MKKNILSFSIISGLLSFDLGIASPVLAQLNANSNPFKESNNNEFSSATFNFTSEAEETPMQQIEGLSRNPPPALDDDMITNVNQLSDVNPEDWAYESLRSLVEKYRCISGFPGANYYGQRAMSRYEFAAGLNTCLLSIRRSLENLNYKFIEKEDLIAIERLKTEFAAELPQLTEKIDNLEERVTFLEEHQFSPSTVLWGRVDFNLINAFGKQKADAPGSDADEDLDDNTTLSGGVVLRFDTTFTGKDRLRTQLVAGNINSYGYPVTGTDMTLLIGSINTGNNLRLGTLFYDFPLGKRGTIAIAPVADFPTRIFPAFNPVNSISNFGAESPIYSFAFGTGGLIYYNFTDKLAGGIAYLTTSGNDAREGLFNGQYTILSQLSYSPTDRFGVAFTYGHYYAPNPEISINVTGSKGSRFAQYPFGANTPTSSDALGLQFTYKLNPQIIFGGWVSYFNAKSEGSPSVSDVEGSQGSKADIWSWALTAFVGDLGKAGSQLSFVFGMPPKVMNNDVVDREDPDTALHFELSYRYPLTDNIFITPGFLVVTNPEHNDHNPPIWIGLVRTSFLF